MKIKGLITTLLGIIVIVAVSLLTLNEQQNQTNMLDRYAKSQLQNATDLISLKLAMFSSGNQEALQSLSEAFELYEEEEWDSSGNKAILKSISEKKRFEDITVCGKDGLGFDLNGKEQKVSFCTYYQRALYGDSTTVFTNFYENSSKKLIVFTVPIYREEEIIGALRASMDPAEVQDYLSISAFKGKEEVYLLQKDGTIVSEFSDEASENDNFLELMDDEEDSYSEIEQVIQQGRAILAEAKYMDTTSLLNYTGIKGVNDWGIMITIPKDQLVGLYHKELVNKDYTEIVLWVSVFISSSLLVAISLVESIRRIRMENLAYYDEVTDSMSINRFRMEANALIHKTSGKNYALIQLAIDRFEYIKEFFGTQEGNRILQYISTALKENIKSDELFCRLNTDYFVLLVKYHNKEELTNRINFLDIKISSFEEENVKNNKYEMRLHYGIYCLKENDADIDLMLSRANHALLQVKNDRKQPYEYYNGEMQNKIADEKEIEEHMYTALEEKEFLVYLQPKYDLNTGLQVGAEALVRWMHPEKGLLYPGRFIGVFEKNGFIVKLDMYILDIICHRLKIWISKGYRPMPLSINISRLNLFDEHFIENVESTLERYGIPANLVQLEIAEEVVSDNVELLSSLMEQLKDYGFLISMDDFGTGTTSMNTLYHVPVDELKLDRKFLLGAEKTDRGKSVIKSIIEMANRLNIKVVSEGVENKVQARMLQELGCDMVQGYAFSDPLPVKEYENYAYGSRANENRIW